MVHYAQVRLKCRSILTLSIDTIVIAEGKRSKLESDASSGSLPTVSQLETLELGPGIRSAPNLSASIAQSSGSSPPSAGGPLSQSGFRRMSSSSSPALYSEAVNSPIKADPYSPDPSSPALSAGLVAKDYRQPGRVARGESRQSGYASHYSAQAPYQSPGYRSTQSDNWQEPKYVSAMGRRQSHDTPPVPPLVHQESTVSSDSVSSGPSPLILMPILDQGKQGTRTLPQLANFGAGAPRSHLLDIRSSQPGGSGNLNLNLPPISAAGEVHEAKGSSNWPALLRATELARQAAMKGTDDLHDDEDSS
jgi:hypothetical protein